ncbi:hypothetical protein EIN_055920 [Entamoeba invadens IP1]|uniref:hypothetical protein n=1 Tax=Entamoeba invadens IP1 TaxID=370355 RepID=UPI0002C3E9FB|nr:hypothetical protein EIN_055920 [Entamoeba invadens IP1]ELP93237.1 hypothetical protein EIN_055920 [Entamoeba invadens IP1]|eukprot:XP_004260008.1 hypothetical protein EIN_055920 [Entamoeba invadens IP1]
MSLEHYVVLVSNIDKNVTVDDLISFFSFTGCIEEIHISQTSRESNVINALIFFDSLESVRTAELMTGVLLYHERVDIKPTTLLHLPDEKIYSFLVTPQQNNNPQNGQTKTSVVASLIAHGYVVAQDTFQKAVEFDKTHNITTSIKSGAGMVKNVAVNVDEKLHLTEYLALGTVMVWSCFTAADDKFKVTTKVSNTLENIDNTLGVSDKWNSAKNSVENGLAAVSNSTPVNAVRSVCSDFSIDVTNSIDKLKETTDVGNKEQKEEQINQQQRNKEDKTSPEFNDDISHYLI